MGSPPVMLVFLTIQNFMISLQMLQHILKTPSQSSHTALEELHQVLKNPINLEPEVSWKRSLTIFRIVLYLWQWYLAHYAFKICKKMRKEHKYANNYSGAEAKPQMSLETLLDSSTHL